MKNKYVISTLLFHIFFAVLFSFVYYWIGEKDFDLSTNVNRPTAYIDYLSLSTSIQAGVGISNLKPNTKLSNLVLTIQQFLLIATNALIVYVIFKS